jgi:hypothetical protein
VAQVPIKTDGSDTNEIKDYRDNLRVQDIVRQMYNETKILFFTNQRPPAERAPDPLRGLPQSYSSAGGRLFD